LISQGPAGPPHLPSSSPHPNPLSPRYYVTPKSFLDLLVSFKALLADKRGELGAARDRLLNGVAKLRETNAQVGGCACRVAPSAAANEGVSGRVGWPAP
jgi:hypothetical protein